jgi:hypothetical protein
VFNEGGVFDRYGTSTGDEVWLERIPRAGGGFSVSPVAVDEAESAGVTDS